MSAKNKDDLFVKINKSLHRKSDKKMKFISWYYYLSESVLSRYFNMPSTPYDLVKDEQDLRIPLHAEQAFFHGITFQAKVNLYVFFLVYNLYKNSTSISTQYEYEYNLKNVTTTLPKFGFC